MPSVAPKLHPDLAGVYRERVAELIAVLDADDAAEARDLVRGLVEQITLHPDGDHLRVRFAANSQRFWAWLAGPQTQKAPQIVAPWVCK